jgi:hypothetical protein
MRKKISLLFCCCIFLFACKDDEQAPPITESISPVPELFLNGDLNQPSLEVVLDRSNGQINQPRDLAFNPERDELWVMNKGTSGSEFIIISKPGKAEQSFEKRRDSHSSHFVVNGTALAFSDENTFATTPEIKNTVADPNATFMGPTLWSSDLSVFAMVNQSNWAPNKPLGSHYDMLHQSPFSMGVAHDEHNSFWVFDGWNGNLVRYHFHADHGPGGEDHRDGEIFRHSDVELTRVPDVPSHMIVDKKTDFIYICDTKNGKVIRVDPTTSGFVKKLTAPNEILAKYEEWNGSTVTTVIEGLNKPCGIALSANRLFVSDYESGMIHVIDINTNEEIAEFDTGLTGTTGIEISPEGALWLVNYSKSTLVKVVPK